MTSKFMVSNIIAMTAVMAMLLTSNPASAYSCKTEFNAAQKLVQEAQALVKPDTDSRILALIEKADGMSKAGFISHSRANQGHVGKVGKFMHGQSVSMGRQAQSIAREALFLLTGETR